MAVTDWNWTIRPNYLGNSDYFKSDYVKHTSRFEHLQCKKVTKLKNQP